MKAFALSTAGETIVGGLMVSGIVGVEEEGDNAEEDGATQAIGNDPIPKA